MAVGALLALAAGAAAGDTFSGTLFFTHYTGGQNVWRVGYTYDEATQSFSLATPVNIASTNGADGILVGANGNLLVGGQGSRNVYEVSPSTGAIIGTQSLSTDSYHLALDPNGTALYTSTFGGPLQTLNLPVGSGVTTTAITPAPGATGDTGITQVAFGNEGTVFYDDGQPNGFANLGIIDLATGQTTRLYTNVQPAHGLLYDPFTDLITMFGAGETGTMNDVDGSNLLTSGQIYGHGDFDQGAVDGFGHALVAGDNGLTLIDYHLSHDITHPDFTTFVTSATVPALGGIDDVAPLTGPGSGPPRGTVPEPGTLLLLGAATAALAGARRRRR